MPLKRFSFLTLILFTLPFTLLLKPAVAVTGFVKYLNNPIFLPGPLGSWDGRYVASPSLLKRDGIYKMWYQANEGSGVWKIGYASSSDGITGWLRLNHPVISVGSSDGWEALISDPRVLYNSTNNIYQMWYSSINSYWLSGPDRFRLRFATSTDGINWTKTDGWIFTGSSGMWDSGGINRGNSIIYKDGIYHMWYAGTNNDNLVTYPFWRIGYATSSNGVNWTKQNGGNPVINPTMWWELNNVSYPTVLLEDGLYKMWYTAGEGEAPTDIVYAYSEDGINWIKPASENPVLTRTSGSFDSIRFTLSDILKESDHYRLYFSGYNGSNWAVGLATNPAIEVVATPTPTSTPTPTPIPADKVVIIPGFGGSWNAASLLSCGFLDNGEWVLNPLAAGAYNPILNAITTSGYTPLPFYYDWRKDVIDNIPKLSNWINTNTTVEDERFHLVGHSMGGLVGRAYLENQQTNNRLERFMTVGSPHQGTAFAYPLWAAGDVSKEDLLFRFAATF
ncbi:MAG: laminin G, partial [uncultured bacterium]